MTLGPLNPVLRHIRRIASTSATPTSDDAHLLARFLDHRDEDAFATLVKRHGPMVLGVCRRVLSDSNDVDDAFQATFLVLLRKAHSLGNRALLANWLYGVAHRTALKARSRIAWRRLHETRVPDMPGHHNDDDALWRDVRVVLDDELCKLPQKYRVPVVLCYLEGKTFTEAAELLGWPAGTVAGRLARAREMLRVRLSRRGLTLASGLVGTLLAERTLPAAVPPALAAATIKSALILTAGNTAAVTLSASVTTLMEGVLHNMLMTKLRIAAIVLLTLTVIGTGAGVASYNKLTAQQRDPATTRAPSAEQPARQQAEAKAAEEPAFAALSIEKAKAALDGLKVSATMRKLLLDRFESAHTEFDARWKEFLAGRGTLDICFGASQRLLKAERALNDKKLDEIAALERHLERLKKFLEVNEARWAAGRIAIQDVAQSRFYCFDAEIALEEAKQANKTEL